MASLVSVIIPCFNSENTIDRSICSVYEQNWPSIELIVINDGSTDKSEEHIKYWEKQFVKKEGYILKYIAQKNLGPGGAVKTGLNYITGRYLTLLDADDRFMQGSVSERAIYLDTHPECAMVRSNGYIISGENKWLFTESDVEKTGNVFEMVMCGKTYNWAGSYMVRTELLLNFYQEHAFYESRFGQNLQIMIPMANQGKCGFIDKPLMEYFWGENSLTRETDHRKAKEKKTRNAEGFLDIRRHVISSLPIPIENKNKWKHIAEVIYSRSLMRIGLEYEDIVMANKAVYMLKKLRAYSIDDRIVYYKNRNNTIGMFWRGVRRMLNTIYLRK